MSLRLACCAVPLLFASACVRSGFESFSGDLPACWPDCAQDAGGAGDAGGSGLQPGWQGLAGSDFGDHAERTALDNPRGSSLNSGLPGRLPALALSSAGQPALAWMSQDDVAEVSLLSGDQWQRLGSTSTRRAELAFDEQDRLHLTIRGDQPGLQRWSGDSFQDLGDPTEVTAIPGTASQVLLGLTLARSRGAPPLLAWISDVDFFDGIYAARHDGQAWQVVPGSETHGSVVYDGMIKWLSCAARGESSALTFHRFSAVYLAVDRGDSWSSIRGIVGEDRFGIETSLSRVALTSDGVVILGYYAYENLGSQRFIAVKRVLGDGPEELAAAGTRSVELTPDVFPTLPNFDLTLDEQDRIYVAWADHPAGEESPIQVYVARWDGAAWAGLYGSRDDWGVSNSDATCQEPVIDARAGRVCVAWSEAERVAMRCAPTTP